MLILTTVKFCATIREAIRALYTKTKEKTTGFEY